MMSKKQFRKEQKHRPPITSEERLWMFAVAIRLPQVFEQTVDLVTADVFTENELWLSLVWDIAREHFQKRSRLPSPKFIANMCNARVKLNPDALGDADVPKLNKFLKLAADLDEEDLDVMGALDSFQRFMEDRLKSRIREAMSLPQTPVLLADTLSEYSEKASALLKLTSRGLQIPFVEDWNAETKIGKRSPTNITFIDFFMNGGTAPGESYGLLGPYGSGKSTLAVMVSAEAARAEFERWETSGRTGIPAKAYHFAYESTKADLQILSLSYLAAIPRTRLELLISGRDLSLLSREGDYQDYERKRFRRELEQGLNPDGEYRRFNKAIDALNQCSRFVDMTGSNIPNRGNRLVTEISEIIKHDIARSGAGCLTVVVDYVLAAIRGHLKYSGKDRSEARTLIQDWPLDMKQQVALRFDCATWSLQQLNSESNAMPPGHLPKMTDAAECRSFAENCDFVFVMGVPTRNGQLPFAAQKHRREGDKKPIVLTLRGDEAKIVDSRAQWEIDARTKTIVRREAPEMFCEVPHRLANGSMPASVTNISRYPRFDDPR
jgi:hypothetical protein